MLKQENLQELVSKAINDNITTGHLKILMYLMAHENLLSIEAPKMLSCSQQYCNKLFNDLLEKGYLERGKIEHTRIYSYKLLK
uniref:HTH marR-type domain-containing protein n=1 Tax=uncultured prokaryote TaxID=198431 RepID=A0A0H5Q4I0_9ZZZZ|nr:hypothetical protein [uncultured prokaryote]